MIEHEDEADPPFTAPEAPMQPLGWFDNPLPVDRDQEPSQRYGGQADDGTADGGSGGSNSGGDFMAGWGRDRPIRPPKPEDPDDPQRPRGPSFPGR